MSVDADDIEIRAMTKKDHTIMAVHGKKRFWTKKKAVAGGIAAAVLLPAAAWAAVSIFGFGTIQAAAATTPTLTIDDTTYPTVIEPQLAPGQDAGVKIAVKNPNGYKVTVNSVIIKNGSLSTTGGTAGQCQVTVNGTSAAFPNADGTTNGAGKKVDASEAVELNPNEVKYVTFPAVFHQDASATKICNPGADFAVVGTAGS